MSKQMVRVGCALKQSEIDGVIWPPFCHEWLWAENAGNENVFRILSSPFYAKNLSIYDIVVAREIETDPERFELKTVEHRSGWSTFQAFLEDHPLRETAQQFLQALEQIGCQIENEEQTGMSSIGSPPKLDAKTVEQLLMEAEKSGILTYEVGWLGECEPPA